jgi:hypothetical protein
MRTLHLELKNHDAAAFLSYRDAISTAFMNEYMGTDEQLQHVRGWCTERLQARMRREEEPALASGR